MKICYIILTCKKLLTLYMNNNSCILSGLSGHSIHGLIIHINSYYEMQFTSTKAPSSEAEGLLLK